LVEDKDEMSLMEYAIVSNAEIKVVKVLQKELMTIRRQQAKTSNAASTKNTTAADDVQPVEQLPRSLSSSC
jgi:hypothetical protein